MTEQQVLFFEIKGVAEMSSPSSTDGDDKTLGQVVSSLNAQADAACEKIEREVKNLLPPGVTVRADLQFEAGSLIVSGTVAVLAWGGSIVLEVLRKQTEEQLSLLVKVASQRAMNRFIGSQPNVRGVQPMMMTVTPLSSLNQSRAETQSPTLKVDEHASPNVRREDSTSKINYLLLVGAILVIFLVQLALLFDRFFVLLVRP